MVGMVRRGWCGEMEDRRGGEGRGRGGEGKGRGRGEEGRGGEGWEGAGEGEGRTRNPQLPRHMGLRGHCQESPVGSCSRQWP